MIIRRAIEEDICDAEPRVDSFFQMEEALFLSWLRVAVSLSALAAVLALRVEGAPLGLYASVASAAVLLAAWASVRYRREGEGKADVTTVGVVITAMLVGIACWTSSRSR